MERVWWDVPEPADSVGALQALVGRLRRTLGRQAVLSVEGGYRLAAEREDVDVFRFGHLAGEGTRALAGGEAGKAAGLLADALALWRGEPEAGLLDVGRAARLENLRLTALRARIEARMALKGPEEVLTAAGEGGAGVAVVRVVTGGPSFPHAPSEGERPVAGESRGDGPRRSPVTRWPPRALRPARTRGGR